MLLFDLWIRRFCELIGGEDEHPTAFRQRLTGMAPLSGPRRLDTEFEHGVAMAVPCR